MFVLKVNPVTRNMWKLERAPVISLSDAHQVFFFFLLIIFQNYVIVLLYKWIKTKSKRCEGNI